MIRLFWEAIHQLIVHPLLFFTRNAEWVSRLHDYTKERAFLKKVEYQPGFTALLDKFRRNKKRLN